jgi:hypothetical protein
VIHNESPEYTDTLENLYGSEYLIHGAKRIVVFDTNYVKGELEFRINGPSAMQEKIDIKPSSNQALIIDKGQGSYPLQVRNKIEKMEEGTVKKTISSIWEWFFHASQLGISDAINGRLELVASGVLPAEIAVSKNLLPAEADRTGKITIDGRKAPKTRIYKGYISQQEPGAMVFPNDQGKLYFDLEWQEYIETWLGADVLYMVSDEGGKSEIQIKVSDKSTLAECLTEYRVKAKNAQFFEPVEVVTPYHWTGTWNNSHIALDEYPARFELELFSGVKEKHIRENLVVKAVFQGGRNELYPTDLFEYVIYDKGFLQNGLRMEIVNEEKVRFWNIDAKALLEDNTHIVQADNSRFSIDVPVDDFQSTADTDIFSKQVIAGENHYQFGKAQRKTEQALCIVDAYPTGQELGPLYAGGFAAIEVVTHGDRSGGQNNKLFFNNNAKWFMFSGHNHTGVAGFDLGSASDEQFVLADLHTQGFSMKDVWPNTELLILNTCFAAGVNDLRDGEWPVDANPSDVDSKNPGLQWLVSTKGAVILGWGGCTVTHSDGSTSYFGTGTCKSPSDCSGLCTGNNSWTADMINKFMQSVDMQMAATKIAELWVQSAKDAEENLRPSKSWQNAVGIAAIPEPNNKVAVHVYGIRRVDQAICEAWSMNRQQF